MYVFQVVELEFDDMGNVKRGRGGRDKKQKDGWGDGGGYDINGRETGTMYKGVN